MKAIGGYFELECGQTPLYYQDGVYLNICRSAIRYLIRALNVKRMYVPVFTCNVVHNSIRQEGCELIMYKLGADILPQEKLPKDAYIIYNNYFGVFGQKVAEMSEEYPNLIVDNAQAFYSNPQCRAAIYSPRKFFGLPDSGILRGRDIPELTLNEGHSFEVTSHLLKRHDYGAQAAYQDFCVNDEALEQYPLATISPLSRALMGNIDYEGTKQRRLKNFRYLQKNLPTDFPISMVEEDVPLVYPLLREKGAEIRNKLIQNNIFCARYWPNVLNDAKTDDIEYNLTMNVVPIPIDQRYGLEDMDRIISSI